jgi:amino acid transporter
VSIAFYLIGFAEAVLALLGGGEVWHGQAIAVAAAMGLFLLAWLGADVATKFQYVVMVVLAAALVAFGIGSVQAFDAEQLARNTAPAGELPFWVLFAIFFPAVTGFTQGISMSGDLRDAGKSIPRGTFAAVGLSALVYLGAVVLFAGAAPGSVLVADFGAMRSISSSAWLIDAGVIAATLSSALASFLGAPRILQSLAQDRVFRVLTPFAKGHGKTKNPRRGVLLSFAIALLTIGLGDLNVVAPVVSMFFLISYGLLNYATFYEARTESPSFRPTFKWFHPLLSLAGGLGCGAVMLAIQPTAGVISIAIVFAIWQFLRRTQTVARWADSSRSALLQRARTTLLKLAETTPHDRNWRPLGGNQGIPLVQPLPLLKRPTDTKFVTLIELDRKPTTLSKARLKRPLCPQ